MSLAPVYSELESTVQRQLAGETLDRSTLSQVFARARSFLLESESLFREVKETLLTDDVGQQKLTLAEQELAHAKASLDKLSEASLEPRMLILKDRLNTFLTAVARCLEGFSEFAYLQSLQPIYSPIPVFDGFLKCAIKVLEKSVPPGRLKERFPNLVPEVGRLQRLVGMLPKLHQIPEDLESALAKAISGLESGMGAVSLYFENSEPAALQDSIRLIGSSTSILVDRLERAESLASQASGFTTFRPLEEWLRFRKFCLEQQDPSQRPSLEWTVGFVSDIFRTWDFLLGKAQELLNHPLLGDLNADGVLQPESLLDYQKYRQERGAYFAEASAQGWLKVPEESWTSLRENLESLEAQTTATHQALEHLMKPFKELPGLERIAGLKREVKNGNAHPKLLESELRDQLEKVEELITSVATAQDQVSTDFRDLLPQHRSAFMGMIENLAEENWTGFEALWSGLLTTLPHLAELSRLVRHQVQRQSSSAKQVACIRCQAKNEPGRRVCSTCGATMPTVIQRIQGTHEIDMSQGDPNQPASPPPTLSPKAIDLLENLVANAEANRVNRVQVGEALQLLIDEINNTRKTFGSKVLPLMGKEDVLDAYLRFFAQALGNYFAGLMEMYQFAEGGGMAQLHSGLVTCREALSILDELKGRIDEALRG